MIVAGLLGGIGAGMAGAIVAIGAGYGLLAAGAAYVLVGMLGMLIVATAVALCPNRWAGEKYPHSQATHSL